MTRVQNDGRLAAGLWALAMLFYGITVPTGLMGADNAEFATLSVTSGVAHPPGYPLYTLYLRAMSWLPAASTAHAAGLATAALGAGTVAMSFLAVRAYGFGRAVAVLAALAIGVDASIWAMHSHAEVFALNNLIAASILWAAAPGSRRGLARAATLGLLAGLGLANHHSIVLLAPVGLWGMWRATRETDQAWKAIVLGCGMGLVGLTPYLYLLAAAGDCVDCLQWGRLDSFKDLWRHVSRADYGTTQLRPDGTYDPVAQWTAFGAALLRGSLGVVVLGTLGGALFCWRERRGLLLAVGATFVLTGVVFVGMFNIEPDGIGAQLVSRFYALPIVVLAPLVGAGFHWLQEEFGRHALRGIGIAVIAIGCFNAFGVLDEHRGVIDAYLHDTFEPLPGDAIVFATGDHRTFGAAYVQLVEGVRPDVDWVDGKLLAYDWYVERLEARLDRELPRTDEDGIPIVEVLAAALQTGRPVFLANPFFDGFDRLPSYPIGTVIRVVPPGSPLPAPTELAARNAEVFETFQIDTPHDKVSNPWEREVYEHYRRPWDSLAGAFEAMGDDEAARRARQMEAAYSDKTAPNPP
jgi:hypothetical protein